MIIKMIVLFILCAGHASGLIPIQYYIPSNYTEHTFSVRLNHYDFTSTEKFEIRYFLKSEYFNQTSSDGPIFLYCGNEGPIELFMNNTGYIDYLAEQMKALIIYAEHRYFGKSLPAVPSNKKYLSPHQALADYAFLANSYRLQNNPVIAFGGGYGGMLSSWLRMKYPNIVTGAIASSAPVNHFYGLVDPLEFSYIVTSSFVSIEPYCPALIHEGFRKLKEFYSNYTYYIQIGASFNTCEAIEEEKDMLDLIEWLKEAFFNIAIHDYPYETYFYSKLPANAVNTSCALMDNIFDYQDTWKLFAAMKNATNVYYNYDHPEACTQFKIKSDKNYQAWDYLKCAYLNMPISSDGLEDMFFNDIWDQSEVNYKCLEKWGVSPNIDYPQIYFGSSIHPEISLSSSSNILFSNGQLDPWKSGSITELNTTAISSFVMEDTAHQMDLQYPNKDDPDTVTHCRKFESQKIAEWLEAYYNY